MDVDDDDQGMPMDVDDDDQGMPMDIDDDDQETENQSIAMDIEGTYTLEVS